MGDVASFNVCIVAMCCFLMIRRPPRSTQSRSSAASDVYKRQVILYHGSEDDIVDPEKVKDIASRYFAALEYHLVPDDHVLHETFPSLDWKKLLTAG